MNCKVCGNAVSNVDRICGICGNDLEAQRREAVGLGYASAKPASYYTQPSQTKESSLAYERDEAINRILYDGDGASAKDRLDERRKKRQTEKSAPPPGTASFFQQERKATQEPQPQSQPYEPSRPTPAYDREEPSAYERGGLPPYEREEPSAYERGGLPPYERAAQTPYEREEPSAYERGGLPPYERGSLPPYDRETQPAFGRDEPSAYDRGGLPPYDRETQPAFGRDEPSPYERAAQPAFGRDEPSPYERAARPAFGREEPSPYERAAQPPYGREEPSPYERAAQPPYGREEPSAYERGEPPAYGRPAKPEPEYEQRPPRKFSDEFVFSEYPREKAFEPEPYAPAPGPQAPVQQTFAVPQGEIVQEYDAAPPAESYFALTPSDAEQSKFEVDKKNEQFQELLDREFERLKKRDGIEAQGRHEPEAGFPAQPMDPESGAYIQDRIDTYMRQSDLDRALTMRGREEPPMYEREEPPAPPPPMPQPAPYTGYEAVRAPEPAEGIPYDSRGYDMQPQDLMYQAPPEPISPISPIPPMPPISPIAPIPPIAPIAPIPPIAPMPPIAPIEPIESIEPMDHEQAPYDEEDPYNPTPWVGGARNAPPTRDSVAAFMDRPIDFPFDDKPSSGKQAAPVFDFEPIVPAPGPKYVDSMAPDAEEIYEQEAATPPADDIAQEESESPFTFDSFESEHADDKYNKYDQYDQYEKGDRDGKDDRNDRDDMFAKEGSEEPAAEFDEEERKPAREEDPSVWVVTPDPIPPVPDELKSSEAETQDSADSEEASRLDEADRKAAEENRKSDWFDAPGPESTVLDKAPDFKIPETRPAPAEDSLAAKVLAAERLLAEKASGAGAAADKDESKKQTPDFVDLITDKSDAADEDHDGPPLFYKQYTQGVPVSASRAAEAEAAANKSGSGEALPGFLTAYDKEPLGKSPDADAATDKREQKSAALDADGKKRRAPKEEQSEAKKTVLSVVITILIIILVIVVACIIVLRLMPDSIGAYYIQDFIETVQGKLGIGGA